MIENGFTAEARCSVCRAWRQIDLAALAGKVGLDYSLWNRRCRCRLTDGCRGWIRFFIGPGWPAPSFDERTELRWIEDEWNERHRR